MLIQSWQRTKATSFVEYKKAMDLLQNTSNNTVYADAEGHIAYWNGNFIPVSYTHLDVYKRQECYSGRMVPGWYRGSDRGDLRDSGAT